MDLPVGVFDSGLGGLSVAARILDTLPNERILYFADNAHVPYGEKPLDEIRGFALEITSFLINNGAKAVVMACNMSSAIALNAAQECFPEIPIIGMIEPGARAALRVSNGRPIGVLATTGTTNSGAYPRIIEQIAPGCKVVSQACPRFVPLVESGQAESEDAEAAARTYVEPLLHEHCGTIILGCTHYPFLRKVIEAAAGPDVKVIDPADEVARALAVILRDRNMAATELTQAHEYFTSGDPAGFATLGSAFMGRPIDTIKHAQWGVDLGRAMGVEGK